MSDSPPRPKIPTSYTWWVPVAPFWVIVHGWPMVHRSFPDLDAAVVEFVRSAMPSDNDTIAYIADDNGLMLVGYNRRVWVGVERGFDALLSSEHVDHLEVQMAASEVSARRAL